MSDMKSTNRGGTRVGAGRKSEFDKIGRPRNGSGRPHGTKTTGADYKPKINPVKELEKLYKELGKVKTKDELLIVQAKIDLLNKLLPYAAYKKPTADLNQTKEVIPEMTVLTVKTGGEPSEPKNDIPPKILKQEDFV